MTEVAEGVDTSIALVKMIKHRCKGYRLDLKVRFYLRADSIQMRIHTMLIITQNYTIPPSSIPAFTHLVSHTVWRRGHN
jgi:hypothetical protein